MKKKYIIPQLLLTQIGCESLIADSLRKFATGADTDVVLVKENDFSRPSYNVWDDDWSSKE